MSPTPPVDWTPKPKVIAGVLAGALVTIGAWVLSAALHITEPPEVVGAEVVVISAIVAYLVPGAG